MEGFRCAGPDLCAALPGKGSGENDFEEADRDGRFWFFKDDNVGGLIKGGGGDLGELEAEPAGREGVEAEIGELLDFPSVLDMAGAGLDLPTELFFNCEMISWRGRSTNMES